jgi:TonB family protein
VISPQPNLTFPGTEPGVRGGSSTTSSNSGIVTLNSTTASANARTGNNTTTTLGTGRDAFPGITILGGDSNSSAASRNSNSTTVAPAKTPRDPLQTSYSISILASGGTGGGLPDVGVFSNEQVHTVYLDMRETIEDEPVSWTVAFGVKQPDATSDNERVTNVGGQQEVVLPFPIEKTRPAIPADLVRRYSGRLVLAYAMVNIEGKMEQLSIKQSPDPALNELVLSALRKWSFRPARRNGEVIPAKILLGVIVRTY